MSQLLIGVRMINSVTAILFSSLLLLASSNVVADNFFSNLKESEVQSIFDQADRSKEAVFLTNNSSKPIPAVQILPPTDKPKTAIAAATRCIKLYSCNQSICLVGLLDKKYATNETVLSNLTQLQENSSSCHSQQQLTENLAKASKIDTVKEPASKAINWVKVIKVNSDDSLNVRKSTSYKSAKLGQLAYNARCVKQLICSKKWCKVEYKSLTGWVNKSYLAPLSSATSQQCL